MQASDWWTGNPGERFWLEATDRRDIGANLQAPLTDDSGRDNWRYTLFRRARVGDVVLHYDSAPGVGAIVGASTIAGPAQDAPITWAARGSYARAKGTTPHQRPGYMIPLAGFTRLSHPVTLQQLRASAAELRSCLPVVKNGQATYFPFELSSKREPRLLQGYAFKLPRAVLALFPSLAAIEAKTEGMPAGGPVATDAPRNPPWSRDELILALHLYLTNRASPPGKTSPEVLELSATLAQLGRALGRPVGAAYRNANGVYMKMMNFRRLDPEFTSAGRKGLSGGNKDEEVVWETFAADPARLAAVASAIRANLAANASDHDSSASDADEMLLEAPEGAILTRNHRRRERDPRLVVACKKLAMKKHGRLHCWACGFDFAATYGDFAEGIIDCHHTKPVHTLEPGATTKVADLALLCSNCHRVIHSQRPWLTLEQLRARLTKQTNKAQAA